MKTRLASVAAAAVAASVVLSPLQAADSPLQATLTNALASHAKACRSGKESEIAKTMCSYRLATIRNHLADAHLSLTADMIKEFAENLPDLTKDKTLSAVEKGPTAAVTYKRDEKPRAGITKPKVEFGAVKFIKEDGTWKVDAVGEYEADKFDAAGKETALDWAQFPPTFQVDGKTPETPKPRNAPDFTAGFDIFSPGYTTVVSVNGVVQATAVNTSSSGQVNGGLKKGANEIVVTITKTDKKTPFKPTVTIKYLAAQNDVRECFTYAPKDSIEGTHAFTFAIK
jgi:hypothetical protein